MLTQQPNLEVVAVEPNEAMVGKFRALQPHIPIHQAAAQDLPFEDKSFDAVCAAQVHQSYANWLLYDGIRGRQHVNAGPEAATNLETSEGLKGVHSPCHADAGISLVCKRGLAQGDPQGFEAYWRFHHVCQPGG